jgi:hypothetical protein
MEGKCEGGEEGFEFGAVLVLCVRLGLGQTVRGYEWGWGCCIWSV